ncbi:TIGR04206 family protein [Salinirubellus sp. GCM10025818]|jgi:uncharacterized protein (TIGR04206 family)|uniref:DUF7549 family protein n=1 Tax=Salinirubellus TaxID=2162630 RepID=UPI0030D1F272
MVWVRSEYAGEFAVLSAWVSALVPWSVSFASQGGISLVVLRFPAFMFQFVLGAQLVGGERPFLPVWSAYAFPASEAVARAYLVWLGGAAVFALALALSVVYYAADERLEARLPVDPVRLMGGLLLATAVVLSASIVMLWTSYLGRAVPVGVLFLYAFGYLLLVVERQDGDADV